MPDRRDQARYAASHRRAVASYQARHRAAGLCEECTRPAVTMRHCPRHAAADNARTLQAYYRKTGRGA